MSREENELQRSVWLSVRFLAPAILGSVLMILVAVFGNTAVLLTALGCFVSILGGLLLSYLGRLRRRAVGVERPAVPPLLAANPQLARLYQVICDALNAVADQPEGDFKEVATQKLIALGVQFRAVASGASTTGGAESWYVAHDAILTVPDLKEYRAVVRVPSVEIAQNLAVQESLRATFAAVRRGVLVERVLILPESLWPVGQLLPIGNILPWIEDQHDHRVRVILLRERDLATESAPLIDTCVFNDWAVGTRDLDDSSQTIRVALDFTPTTVRTSRDRLERLSNLGISFRDLLDRTEEGE